MRFTKRELLAIHKLVTTEIKLLNHLLNQGKLSNTERLEVLESIERKL